MAGIFDSILSSLLGQGQQQPYGPQLPGQQQMQQQMPQQGFQTPYQWLALTMHNSGQSWSDTLTKAAAITQNQQKVDNENYEYQMKQQQFVNDQKRKEGLAELFKRQQNGGNPPSLDEILALSKGETGAAALYAANQPQYTKDNLGRNIPLPKVGGPNPPNGMGMQQTNPQTPGQNQSQPYGSPLEEELALKEKFKKREVENERLEKWKEKANDIDTKIAVAEKTIKQARGLGTQFTSGKYAENKKNTAGYFAPFSKNASEYAANIETYDTATAKAVVEGLQQFKGLGPASDRDIAHVEKQVISSKNQPETNKRILDMNEAVIMEIKEQNAAKRKWIEANGTENGFQDFWEKHMDANPVLDIDEKGNTHINIENAKKWKKEFGPNVKEMRKETKKQESKTEDDYLKDIIRQKYPDYEG